MIIIRGRLGNAIFRYMACSIMCIYYNCTYNIENSNNNLNQISMSDNDFINICNNILQKNPRQLNNNLNILMNGFYQHDLIYKINKNYIINFMGKEISMDGILQGRDQQIARPEKIQRECFGWFNIKPEVFYKYGFTPNDLGLN